MKKKLKISQKIVSQSSEETIKIGAKLAKNLINEFKGEKQPEALVIALKGGLGAGKTTFLKGFAKALEIKAEILSPTFIIYRRHRIKNSKATKIGFLNFYHIDCYRLEKAREAEELGFKELFKENKNIVCLEWPEKIKAILPSRRVDIDFSIEKGDKRIITIRERK